MKRSLIAAALATLLMIACTRLWAQSGSAPAHVFELTGKIFQKLADGQYLVTVDSSVLGYDHYADVFDEFGNRQTVRVRHSVTVLLRGEPQARDGDDIACWVAQVADFTYTTETGSAVTVPAYAPTAAPTPTPPPVQQFFGPNSQMQGSALDEPPHH